MSPPRISGMSRSPLVENVVSFREHLSPVVPEGPRAGDLACPLHCFPVCRMGGPLLLQGFRACGSPAQVLLLPVSVWWSRTSKPTWVVLATGFGRAPGPPASLLPLWPS